LGSEPNPAPDPLPDTEPYPSEIPKIRRAFRDLRARFENTRFDDRTMDDFHQAAVQLFGEAGFLVGVTWDEARNLDGSSTNMYLPTVTICARTDPESETDHSRYQYEVTHGLVDGVSGYVRPGSGGQLYEDPKSKDIY
jgi:hypothetical protein